MWVHPLALCSSLLDSSHAGEIFSGNLNKVVLFMAHQSMSYEYGQSPQGFVAVLMVNEIWAFIEGWPYLGY